MLLVDNTEYKLYRERNNLKLVLPSGKTSILELTDIPLYEEFEMLQFPRICKWPGDVMGILVKNDENMTLFSQVDGRKDFPHALNRFYNRRMKLNLTDDDVFTIILYTDETPKQYNFQVKGYVTDYLKDVLSEVLKGILSNDEKYTGLMRVGVRR